MHAFNAIFLFCVVLLQKYVQLLMEPRRKKLAEQKNLVKQLEVEMGQSMEMGTIHAGDFLVC
jgi:hypothetical protein